MTVKEPPFVFLDGIGMQTTVLQLELCEITY